MRLLILALALVGGFGWVGAKATKGEKLFYTAQDVEAARRTGFVEGSIEGFNRTRRVTVECAGSVSGVEVDESCEVEISGTDIEGACEW